MNQPHDPNPADPGPDLDTTGEAETRSAQRKNLRDRMSDVGLIATMAFATIVAVGAILAWALFTGNDNGGGGGGASAKPSTRTLDVTLGEFWVKPATLEVAQNTTLVLNVTNTGAQKHDLQIGAKKTPILNPGQKAVLRTTAIEATVQGYCTLPGHRAAGMVMDINVVGGKGSETASGGANTGIGKGIDPKDAVIDPNAKPAKGFVARDPSIAPAPAGKVHDITIEARDVLMEVAPGVKQMMWVFAEPGQKGTVPGPTIRGKVGDTFNFTIVNKGTIEHSMDFHASEVDPATEMRELKPGESLKYTYTPRHSGVWMYHCGTPPVLHHIANGMYGTVIIDPADGLDPVDHEYALVQSEFYFGEQGKEADLAKAMWGFPDAVVFNGYYNQYVYEPIKVKAGQRIRIFVNDVGPNEISAFHIVGTQFDTVFKEGAYTLRKGNAQSGGAQALDLMPSQGGFVEFDILVPGTYTIVSHKFNDASRGAAGKIIAE